VIYFTQTCLPAGRAAKKKYKGRKEIFAPFAYTLALRETY